MSINSVSTDSLSAPLMQSVPPITMRKMSRNLHKRGSSKEVFGNRKENITLDQLAQDEGYRVHYQILKKIRFLLLILGLWAPKDKGWTCWCLRNVYPAFIYFLILYPWITLLEAYWRLPVFLFINLHLSGIFAYRSARKYWKQKPNHLVRFITSTFIPFYDDLSQFQRSYQQRQDNDNSNCKAESEPIMSGTMQKNVSLKQGFDLRYKKDNRKRKRMAKSNYYKYHKYGIGIGLGGISTLSLFQNQTKKKKKAKKGKRKKQKKKKDSIIFDINDISKEQNTYSWSNIAGTENKLSLSLFYEATQRLWFRFWIITLLTALPIIIILLAEILSKDLKSSISTQSKFKSQVLTDVFLPFNTAITFVRIFYTVCEYLFMGLYFHYICECHRGDLLIHLHYYDTSDINISNNGDNTLQYYNSLEFRLASIVWDWDRITSSTRETSLSLRWWLCVNLLFNFIAGVTAIVNLLTANDLNVFPQHLEMYLPAIIGMLVSFYVLYSGTKISHLNNTVRRRTYFLLANTHFGGKHSDSAADDIDHIKSLQLQVRKQNLYIQAQSVAQQANTRQIGISVYGLVLNRTLFLAFFSPFVAFFLFCINLWLPN